MKYEKKKDTGWKKTYMKVAKKTGVRMWMRMGGEVEWDDMMRK